MPSRAGGKTDEGLSLQGGRIQLLAGGAQVEKSGVWRWASEVKLPPLRSLHGLLPAPDGTFFFSEVRETTSAIYRIRSPCGPGRGYDGNTWRCAPCPINTYNGGEAELQDTCAPCPASSFSDVGATFCRCSPGRLLTDGACVDVHPAHYADGVDSYRCPEKATTFSLLNDAHGVSVPLLSDKNATKTHQPSVHKASWSTTELRVAGIRGAANVSQCDCCFGWRTNPDRTACSRCPAGMWCAGKLASPNSEILQQNGYWVPLRRTGVSLMPHRCAHPSHCWWTPFPLMVRAFNHERCRDSAFIEECDARHCAGLQVGGTIGSCPKGRTGLACSRCKVGSFAPVRGSACAPCQDMTVVIARGAAIVFAVLGLGYATLRTTSRLRTDSIHTSIAAFSSFLCFLEHVRALRHLTDLRWPTWRGIDIASGAEWILWYLFPVPLDCIVGESFVAGRAIMALLPIVVLLTLTLSIAVGHLVMVLWRKFNMRHNNGPLESTELSHQVRSFFDQLCSMLGLLLSVSMFPCVTVAMSYFQCFQHPIPEDGGTRRWSMWWSPEVYCSTGAWLRALPFGVFGLLIPLGWFAAQGLLLRGRCRMSFKSNVWKFVLMRYRVSCRAWEFVAVARAFTLHLCFALAPWIGQQWALMIILSEHVMVFVLVGVVHPFADTTANTFDAALTFATTLLYLRGLSLVPESFHEVVDGATQSSTRHLSTIAAVSALSVGLFVFAVACRDLIFPSYAAKAEKESFNHFAEEIERLRVSMQEMTVVTLTDVIIALDPICTKNAQNSLNTLSQMMQSSSTQNSEKLKSSRLNAFEYRNATVDAELERVATSLRSEVRAWSLWDPMLKSATFSDGENVADAAQSLASKNSARSSVAQDDQETMEPSEAIQGSDCSQAGNSDVGRASVVEPAHVRLAVHD
eukprot:TRINITY_DN16656_c0_g1_i1.p1 TRINITY_DN16656_c0_g1~~TRINITY_DN16656_c0_g1_i1.p1  ORF type:complete len:994 (+),score=136.96 TRINITY_DN16656_c0_g1_i1:245-2983(+)